MAQEILQPELLQQIEGLSLMARSVVEGALHGQHRSPMRGVSAEFAQHREYSPGDEIRHLDWRVLARSDRYVVRQYEQDTNLRAMLVVDRSGSMGYGEKWKLACVLSAAMTHLLVGQGDSAGMVLAGGGRERKVEAKAALSQVGSVCRALLEEGPGGESRVSGTLQEVCGAMTRRGVVMVFSDLFEEEGAVFGALGRLRHGGHEPIVFQILDEREVSFELGREGRHATVIAEMEGGREFEAEPGLIARLVRQEVRRWCERLDREARRMGVHLVRCLTSQKPEEILRRYLHARGAGGVG